MNTRMSKKKLEEKRLQVNMASTISHIIEKEPGVGVDLELTVIKQKNYLESASIDPSSHKQCSTPQ